MATAPMVNELEFKPPTMELAGELYEAMVENGTSHAVARGIIGWLVTLPKRRSEDPAGDRLRAEYRRQLLRLGKPPWVAGDRGAYTQWADSVLAA